jgi:MFS family permease
MATPSPEEREKTAQSSDEEKAHEPSAPRINQLEITSQEKEEHESDSNATGNQGALSSILTDRSALAAEDQREPQPPPDGGLLAWTQAATAHLLIANTWGFVNSFGVFQPYYVDVLGHAPSDISWIGSVQIFLLFAIGTFSGRALDAGFFRLVLIGGCLIHVFGIFMTSLSTKYWQVFLTQGICVGIGNGLLFCPTFSLVATYFAGRRSVAMGIAALGSATGGLVYPAVVQQLLPKIGFAWTVRVLGFIVLSTASLAIAFMKTRLPPRKAGALVELGAFKETSYLLFCIAMFLNFMGIYFTFYYVSS